MTLEFLLSCAIMISLPSRKTSKFVNLMISKIEELKNVLNLWLFDELADFLISFLPLFYANSVQSLFIINAFYLSYHFAEMLSLVIMSVCLKIAFI